MAGLLWSQSVIDLRSGGSLGFPNEPPGTLILNEPWDDVARQGHTPINGWVWDHGDQGTTNPSIQTASPGPYSPSNYMQVLFPSGMGGGGAPTSIGRSFSAGEQFRQLYVGVYFKFSSNFSMGGNFGNKWMWPSTLGGFGGENYMNFDCTDAEDFSLDLTQQGTPARRLGPNTGHDANARFASFLGVWKLIEFVMRCSSSNSTADGEFHGWVDNVKTHQYTDVIYNATAARKFLDFRIEPTYGGGNNPVPANQWMYWDHLRLSGAA